MNNIRETYKLIRDALQNSLVRQSQIKQFILFGKGHEERISLDRSMAAIVRNLDIPRIFISGYGANYFYPKRVFMDAHLALVEQLGYAPFDISPTGKISLNIQSNEVALTSKPLMAISPNKKSFFGKSHQSKQSEARSRDVIITVQNWPDGTLGHRLGHSIRKALNITDEKVDITVIQYKPCRVFQAETSVSEKQFMSKLQESFKDMNLPSIITIRDL